MKSSGANKPRAGAVRKSSTGKQVGSGGQGRQALEGKKPTPKAVDRPYHPAGKRKAADDRFAAAGGTKKPSSTGAPQRSGAPQRAAGPQRTQRPKQTDEFEVVTGRNSVLEALRAKIPVTALYIATRIEYDDRVKEVMQIATKRGLPILEVMRPELDRLAGFDSVHQGLALKVPPYEYAHPTDLLDKIVASGRVPLLVALDGITDPRNLGAIIRSVAAFGGHGVIVPQRRSVGLTAAAWKTSAGAAARTPVAMASNLTQTLKAFKERGVFVLGLDGEGDTPLPELTWAKEPLVVVVGSEGKGLSRLVTETCDAVISIPISASTESLNAGIAASVTLYEISKQRAKKK
ncbi:23S rRNA (guanosine(2251)-2'-O)-methyltransferase RlmB [Frigoribacterium sp. CG_9.8]|jgi:23S rRNA (guanosine2251-2'-O)-methyltransferase|uniref:23S rRNA (guanosine(2251)-2'-O)-methyltransferase RlmB n=1 Tax=Frigoribacterium sp. CG_9.8 TaxID=2787733 RepID=UPI0018CB0C26|nr:23S rRNA (guanosine(2251)-2'-O)-methyltransferase RlmB [Frigoribacterium sp. CG_9.8]MBG6108458.1 23S rRNA (guanosine2251-2'-O)-methyltransferase [Frigoribacterium sp. CG_9.8]